MIANNIAQISIWLAAHPVTSATVMLWSLVWKGIALWKAAELRQRVWFTALLIINTLGLLEIIYIFGIARKYKVEVVEG